MKLINYYKLTKKFINLIINLKTGNILKLIKFYRTYKKYRCLNDAEEFSIYYFYPGDIPTTPFDAHYFYQGVWALRKIKGNGVKNYIDVGSEIS